MALRKKLRALWERRRFEEDLAEEIRIHREMAAEAGVAGRFGSEALALEDSRAVWSFRWLDSLAQDVRFAIRGFQKTPLFALMVIGTIGVALGLNTTLFTVFDTYVLRPVAVHDPYSLYSVSWVSKTARFGAPPNWNAFERLRKQDAAFSDALATSFLFAAVDGRFALGQLVSGNYFTMLRPGAFMGRLIEREDAAAEGAGAVMVLNYSAWQNRYGGDPGIIGRKVQLRGQPFEIIGIAQRDFGGLGDVPMDFWIPMSMTDRVTDTPGMADATHPLQLRLTARLKPGVSEEAGKAVLMAWATAATRDLPPEQRATGVHMVSSATAFHLTPIVLAAFSPILIAFGLVLLAACANVSNMMLARAMARQREIGIRVSLGAGRLRLVRQLLTESLLLAAPAAVAGFAVSQITIGAAQRLMFATVPTAYASFVRVPRLDPDGRVFMFILLVSLAATLVFGLIPAVQTTRSNLVAANRGDFGHEYRPTRLRNALVAAQAMVCCLLLIYSAILLRAEQRMTSVDLGIRTRGVFDVRTSEKYHIAAVKRLSAQPGVEAVAGAWQTPLYNALPEIAMRTPGGAQQSVPGTIVSAEYFDVFRIPMLRGRKFSAAEARSGAPVAVISEAAAKRFWPGREALDQTIELVSGLKLLSFHSARVIGIARNATTGYFSDATDSTCVYFPGSTDAGALLVSVRGEKDAGRRLVEAAMNEVVPGGADQVNAVDEVMAVAIYPFRVLFWVGGFLAGLALLLTASGIYGVLSYIVSQRSKEIGIRMALGASGGSVVRMVVRQSLWMAGIGATVGAACALAVAPVFANRVQMLRPYDPLAYAAAAGLVCAAGVMAAVVPSRRAAEIDPMTALRCD